jgi:probable phosphoglycerate mutase
LTDVLDTPPPELWLARHGETEWTVSRQHTGSTDIPLTERGREQARELLPSFEGIDFDLVLSSPASRAVETAELAGFEPEIDQRLREWDYGDYEGLTTVEIQRDRPEWFLFRDGCPNGEDPTGIGQRLEPLLDELRGMSGKRIARFGHAHCFRALAGCWLGLGAESGRALTLGTASLSVIGVEHGRPAIAHWNAVPLVKSPTPASTLDATRRS